MTLLSRDAGALGDFAAPEGGHSSPPLATVADRSEGPTWLRRYVFGLLVSDIVVVSAAMACAQMVRLGRPVTQFDPLTKYFGLLSVIFGLMWLGMLAAYGTRSPRIVGA